MKLRHVLFAGVLAVGISSAAFGQVTGTAKLDGKAPKMKQIDMSGTPACGNMHQEAVKYQDVVADEDGNLQNVVVYLKPADGQNVPHDPPKDPAVIDQKGCTYTPHIVVAVVGQKVKIVNDDSLAHNIHSQSEKNAPFNLSQPNTDPGKIVDDATKTVETYKIKCDVHSWMGMWMVVLDNPYFAVTTDDGTFSIDTKGLADGDYSFVAWQEKYGTSEPQKVHVKDGKADKTMDFVFKAK